MRVCQGRLDKILISCAHVGTLLQSSTTLRTGASIIHATTPRALFALVMCHVGSCHVLPHMGSVVFWLVGCIAGDGKGGSMGETVTCKSRASILIP